MGHSIDFLVSETYGEEVSSIRQTASLWTKQIAGYIGPQETCVHEGRMAAAFNLPMISYVSFEEDIFRGQIFILNIIFGSFVQIKKLHIKKTFQHLQELVHPTHKSQNQLFHYCLLTIGLK